MINNLIDGGIEHTLEENGGKMSFDELAEEVHRDESYCYSCGCETRQFMEMKNNLWKRIEDAEYAQFITSGTHYAVELVDE